MFLDEPRDALAEVVCRLRAALPAGVTFRKKQEGGDENSPGADYGSYEALTLIVNRVR